ncbi:MAG TPA: TIR domain-containing protein [Chthoniobacterales bacterium]|nr:TIR domain-containing protein [Chthoniobacterales bacterium]
MATSAGDKAVPQRAEVFISYSRKDREFVRRLEEALESRGRETWVDWQGIRPAEEFMQAIFPAIEGADTFVFVLSPDSVSSEICGKELAHAVSQNKRMIPIMARDTEAKAVPEPLAKLNWVFARDADSFEAATDFLISALDTDLGWVRAHTRLLTRAIEWEAQAKSNSFILRGEDLRSAEQWLAQAGTEKERQPTVLQTEYIISSRKGAARRQRILWGSISVALIVTGMLAVGAYFQRQAAEQQRRIAGARQLATQAELIRNRSADALQSSVVMAVQSMRQFRSLEAEQVLRRALALLAHPVTRFVSERPLKHVEIGFANVFRLRHHPVAAFSSDARFAAIVLADESVELYEVRSHRLIATMKHASAVEALQFSPDGKLLATAAGAIANVWETERGQAVVPAIQHPGRIRTLAISADGRLIVTGSEDGTTRTSPLSGSAGFQPQTLRPGGSLSGPVDAVAISPDSKYVAISRRTQLTMWEAATGQRVDDPAAQPVKHNRQPDALAFSPDGTALASAGEDNALHVLETASGRESFVVPEFSRITGVAFSPRGNYIATASDMTARIWETGPSHRMMAKVVHEGRITLLVFSPDEASLAVASEDNTARVWAIENGEETLRITHDKPVWAIAYSADGDSVATAGGEGMVALWESRTGPELAHNRSADSPSEFRFGRDGRCIATITEGKGAVLWDSATGAPISIFQGNGERGFVLTDDLRLSAVASGEAAEVWDVASGKLVATMRHEPPIDWAAVRQRPGAQLNRQRMFELGEQERQGSVEVVGFSPDGRFLLTRRFEDEGRVWDASNGREKWRFQSFTKPVLASFSPNSNLLAVANKDSVRIFAADSGREQAIIRPSPGLDSLAFSADSRRLAAAGDTGLHIWDGAGRKIAELKHDARISGPLVRSPSSSLIATADENGLVKVWNAEDGSQVDTVVARGPIRCLAFSPDGALLATAGEDFTARVREVRKQSELAVFNHLAAVLTVSFSADGKLLVTGSRDQTARVWDIRAAEEIAVINHLARFAHRAPSISAATLSPDGRFLVTGEGGGMARVWPLRPADLIKQAAARITRPLRENERKALEDEP